MLASTAATEHRHLEVGQVYRDHFAFVWTNLRRFGVSPELVEDACHDVFVIVHRRASEFDPDRASLRTWVFGIVRRVASDHRRSRQRRERKLSRIRALPERRSGPATAEARSLALQFLGTIDEEHAAIFVLSQLYDVPLREIAASLNLNPNTVASRLRATRKRFKALSDREEIEQLTNEESPPEGAKEKVLAGLCPLLIPPPQPTLLIGLKGLFLGLCIASAVALVAVAQAHSPGGSSPEGIIVANDGGLAEAGALEATIPDVKPVPPRSDPPIVTVVSRPRRRTPQSRTPPVAEAPSPASPNSSLRAELALVTEARSAVRDGKPTLALRTARTYAKRFPQGLLHNEMDVVRVDSLCRLGRQDDAAALAKTLGVSKGSSPKAVCPASG